MQRSEMPKFKEQIALLKDLEMPSMFRMKDFPNEKLISLLKAYTMLEQGSSRFFNNIFQQIKKRINSFSHEELSTIVYFLSNVKQTDEIFAMVEHILMNDPFNMPHEIIGKLSFAYSIKKIHSPDLFKVLSNIFCVCNEKISPENGYLFLTGIYKVGQVSAALKSKVETWVLANWDSFASSEISHIIYILFKLDLIDFAISQIQKIDLESQTVMDIDKILGCFIEKNIKIPDFLLDHLYKTIQDLEIAQNELIGLTYTLEFVEDNKKYYMAMQKVLEKTFHLISSYEKTHIFIATISVKQESTDFLELFKPFFTSELTLDMILSILPVFTKRKNVFLPYTKGVFDSLSQMIQGKVLKTQELIMCAYSLCIAEYNDEQFWQIILKALTYTKISSAEEYIQAKKTVKEIGKLGIDVTQCLGALESRYEVSN
ncbi:hypothetical protein SteCoe_7738 [Stentor coeruleus]|uniref:Uncharacterized protein n=1 Tax=Stentor coeruleus TaxID=5963 RepID=A0A1R2CLQ3_9CILI|nr:hypothetical protein SteCoe_7738 [Stentor coeruleus]